MADGLHALSDRAATDLSLDGFFGGRLLVRQPTRGHRSGTDAVLLAMAAPRDFAGHVMDVGSGVGVCGLGLACIAPSARVTLVERDPVMAALAHSNAASNALDGRTAVQVCDILASPRSRPALDPADLVLTNPPFHEAVRARASPVPGRRDAHVLAAGHSLTDWIRACLGLLADRGALILIHTPAAVPEILASIGGGTATAVTLMSVHPRKGAPARRVLVRAVKGSRAPFTVAAPLVLHGEDAFTPEADALHRGDVSLAW